jgi:hypothetical protein
MNSLLIVQRRPSDGIATLGSMTFRGAPECYTLEPPTPISAGTYPLTIRFSPRFARLMPHVESVPGYTGILIHWGNWAKDTLGCLLVGSVLGTDFVGQSRAEFDSLFLKINDALAEGPATITYLDPQEAAA